MKHAKNFPGQDQSKLPGGTMNIDPFYSLIPMMNKHDSNFWHNGAAGHFWPDRSGLHDEFSPTLDMEEDDEKYAINIELPGVSQDDVEIRVRENSLLIRGEKKKVKREENHDGENYSERSYGTFRRYMRFEDEIDTDQVEAQYKSGLLHITLPKKDAHRTSSKSIPIHFDA